MFLSETYRKIAADGIWNNNIVFGQNLALCPLLAVTGTATKFTEMKTGGFLRIDAFGTKEDSEWYRIIAITHDSLLTLQTAFGLSGATAAIYTISDAPQMPARMHDAIFFDAVMLSVTDQNDPMYKTYASEYTKTITDAKRIFKSRSYNQQIDTVLEEWQYRR